MRINAATRAASSRTQPSRKLPPVVEVLRVANARDQSGSGQGTNARHFFQTQACRAVAVPRLDLHLDLVHLFLQHLEVIEQPLDEHPEGTGQLVLSVFNERRHALSDVGDALWHH